MSCNHSDALSAFQKAKDTRALHKLLVKILDKSPKAVKEAWEDVDLSGHPCPVCKKTGLIKRVSLYSCPACRTIIEK